MRAEGTGDALIQLAQIMAQAGKPCEITYVDLSRAARRVAEARAAARGLSEMITFVTGSLLEAPEMGEFDYIDCCGVLHHLRDPAAGFAAPCALRWRPAAGWVSWSTRPYGRSGVYPLQEAFGVLFGALAPETRLAAAREVMARVPAGHPFNTNPNLGDHRDSDAGFHDLLLHSRRTGPSTSPRFCRCWNGQAGHFPGSRCPCSTTCRGWRLCPRT